MKKRYQFFISSTYEDLKDIRSEATRVILNTGNIPIGMEMFSADDDEQWVQIKRSIDSSDYYIVIVAHRYGSITKEGISYTQKEFEYAKYKKIPILSFIIDDNANVKPANMEKSQTKINKLNKFKDVLKEKPCSFWENKDDFGKKLMQAANNIIENKPRTGWIKANSFVDDFALKEIGLEKFSSRSLEFLKQSLDNKVYYDYYTRNVTIEILNESKEFKVIITNEMLIKNIRGKGDYYLPCPCFSTMSQAKSYNHIFFEINKKNRMDLLSKRIKKSERSRQLSYIVENTINYEEYAEEKEMHIAHKYSYIRPMPYFFMAYQLKVPCRQLRVNGFIKNDLKDEFEFVEYSASMYRGYKGNNYKSELYNDDQQCQINFAEWIMPGYGFALTIQKKEV